jgi:hypothetical protein
MSRYRIDVHHHYVTPGLAEVAVLARHGIEGVVLCYANFYGPAKAMASFVVLSCLARCGDPRSRS